MVGLTHISWQSRSSGERMSNLLIKARSACMIVRVVFGFLMYVLAASAPSQAAGNNYALVIGINDYIAEIERLPPLRFAVPDAVSVKKALEEKNFEVVMLTDSYARREAIISQLTKYAHELSPDDTLLIYFAGHGVRQIYGDRSYSYWLTHDTTLAKLEVDAIRLNHLLQYVTDIPTKRRILVLDHCHSGDVDYSRVLASDGRGPGGTLGITRNAFALDNFESGVTSALKEGLIILGAASDTAYEFEDLKHGIFTKAFLEALTTPSADKDNSGVLSTDELRTYVMERSKFLTDEKEIVQNPIEFASGAVTWDFATLGNNALDQLLEDLYTELDNTDFTRCVEALENLNTGSVNSDDQALVDTMRSLATASKTVRVKAATLRRAIRSLDQ